MNQPQKPNYGRLILVPAVITLVVTLVRLGSELIGLPAWLANRSAGGMGALIGISWLPPLFGIHFALKLKTAAGKLWLNLLKTLVLYGLAARIPVIIIMGFAIYGHWGTHYDAFDPGSSMAQAGYAAKFWLGAVVIQIVWWALIWTVVSGMLTGLAAAFVSSRRPQAQR